MFHDTRGNVSRLGSLYFTYDTSDQPTSMSGTASGGGSVAAVYKYDGHFKRVKSVVNGETIYSVYDRSGALLHLDNITSGKKTDYIHAGGMTVARRVTDVGAGTSVVTSLHPDHLGSAQTGTKHPL